MNPGAERIRVAAITGWTSTGKTSFAHALARRLHPRRAVVLSQDDYYRDTSRLTRDQRTAVNYDEPAAYDLTAFRQHLDALRSGGSAPRFSYDFGSGARSRHGILGPAEFVIAEGLLTLWDPTVRRAADLRILLEGEPARLLERRIRRDGAERSYTAGEVRRRFEEMVIPAQRRYLAGAAEAADLVFPMDWAESAIARAAASLAGDTSASASPSPTDPKGNPP